MSGARDQILGGIRRSLKRGRLAPEAEAELRERVAAHRRNLIPARATALDHRGRVDLFVAMAEEVQATVERVASPAEVPEAVARYLAAENLPAELVMAPDPTLDAIPWAARPLLQIRRGRAEPHDMVSLAPCFAAVAETGTLMLISGSQTPTTLNFLPDNEIVVLREEQVVATYEDAWDHLRAGREAPEGLPRAVNFITGPSRTGDIEQRIVLGAHGPRRLHIVLVEDRRDTSIGEDHNSAASARSDRALWQEVARGVKPLRGRAAPAASVPPLATPVAARETRPSPAEPPPALDRFAGIDRANAERLKRGLRQVEARLDLHGMTQAEAHRALAVFVEAARAAERRCVLVVTGRGLGSSGPGILKASVPRWLEEASLRRHILAIAPAQPRDGGAGALYLLLRRRR